MKVNSLISNAVKSAQINTGTHTFLYMWLSMIWKQTNFLIIWDYEYVLWKFWTRTHNTKYDDFIIHVCFHNPTNPGPVCYTKLHTLTAFGVVVGFCGVIFFEKAFGDANVIVFFSCSCFPIPSVLALLVYDFGYFLFG